MLEDTKKKIAYVFILTGSIGWRRWYGGGFGKAGMITRFWKYVVLIVICAIMFRIKHPYSTFWANWRTYAVIAAFAYHWARSHGDYFFVYSTAPDEGRIRWIDWVLRILYGENGYFNFKGNVTGLAFRYGATAMIVSIFIPNAWFVLAGLLTTLSYVITGKMKNPTNKAEYLAGALNFGLLYLCI